MEKEVKTKTCVDCPLANATNPVPCFKGMGTIAEPSLFIVFDTPRTVLEPLSKKLGTQEINMLNRLLQESGLRMEQCYVTSLVKCNTPCSKQATKFTPAEYALPKSEELKCCMNILKYELETIKPKIIVAMGSSVLKYFMGPQHNLQKSEGVPLKKDNYIVIGTHAPEEVLNKPDKFENTRLTYQKIKTWLVSDPFTSWVDPKAQLLVTPTEVFEKLLWLREQKEWACDIETDGLELTANIYSIAFSTGEETFAFPFRKPDGTFFWKDQLLYGHLHSALQAVFANDALKIFHNAAFDVLQLKTFGIEVNNFADTYLLYYLIDETAKNVKLKYLIWKILGMGGYETEYDNVTASRSAKGAQTDILLKYNANDAYATMLLWRKLFAKIDDVTKKLMSKIVLPLQKLLIHTTYRGVKVDKEYVLKIKQQYEDEIEALLKEIPIKAGRPVDLNSSKDLVKLLYKDLGLRCPKKTKKGGSSVDEESLLALAGEHEVVDTILAYRERSKLVSTYFKPALELADKQSVLHPSFLISGTRTGRLSSQRPNMQNIPREGKIKDIFVPRAGHAFIELDFSQIEFRIFGHYAKDVNMQRDVHNGVDIHRLIASRVYNIPQEQITKDQRSSAKACVVAGTWIPTPAGYRHIETLKPGEYVLDHMGREQKILETMQPEDTVLGIRTSFGSIQCTPAHPFFIFKEGRLTTIKAGDLMVGSEILALPGNNKSKNYLEWQYAGEKRTSFKSIRKTWVLDEQMGWFLGFFLGEGSTYRSKTGYSLRWCQSPGSTEQDVRRIQKDLFGDNIGERFDSRGPKGLYTWRLDSKELFDFIGWAGIAYLGRKGQKTFPDKVMQSPLSIQRAFLTGFFKAEAYYKKGLGFWGVGSVSRDIIDSTVLLLKNFGIVGRVRIDASKRESGYQDFYTITVSGAEQIKRISELFDMPLPKGCAVHSRNIDPRYIPGAREVVLSKHSNGDVRYVTKIHKNLNHSYLNKYGRGLNKDLDNLLDCGAYAVTVKDIIPQPKQKVYDFVTTGDKVMVANGFYTLDCVFGMLFGMGVASMTKKYKLAPGEAQKILDTFFTTYPYCKTWMQMIKHQAKRQGYLRNDFGRTRHFPGISSPVKALQALAERQAVNFMPQSTAADYTFYRALRLEPMLAALDTHMVLTVHDSLVYEAPTDKVKEAVKLIREDMSKQMSTMFIRLDFEMGVGFRLGSTQKIKDETEVDKILTPEITNGLNGTDHKVQ